MRIILTLALILCPFMAATAQSIFVKVGGGFASQFGAEGYNGVAKIALGYEYEFNQTLAFAPSIGITGRGWQVGDVKTPDMLFDEKGNMLDANGSITTNPAEQVQRHAQVLNPDGSPALDINGKPILGDPMWSMMHRSYTANYVQLDLPFNYYHRLGAQRYFTLTAGPWVACGFAGKRTTEGDGTQPLDRKIRYTDKTFSLDGAHRFDCGLKAGLGYQFPSSLTINLEGEFGLLTTNSATEAFAGRTGRNVALMLTLSYKLNKNKWNGED